MNQQSCDDGFSGDTHPCETSSCSGRRAIISAPERTPNATLTVTKSFANHLTFAIRCHVSRLWFAFSAKTKAHSHKLVFFSRQLPDIAAAVNPFGTWVRSRLLSVVVIFINAEGKSRGQTARMVVIAPMAELGSLTVEKTKPTETRSEMEWLSEPGEAPRIGGGKKMGEQQASRFGTDAGI
jgi:hypothetical protein